MTGAAITQHDLIWIVLILAIICACVWLVRR